MENEFSKEELLTRPFPNEHSCDLIPDQYDRFARENCKIKHNKKCIDFLYGIKNNKSELHSMRYPKDIWKASDARAHCKSKGGSFEAASGEKEMDGIKGNDLFYRDIEIDERTIDTEGRKVDLSFSSEIALQRWFGQEILSHKEDAIIKGRLHSMLFGHDSKAIVGPIKNINYDDGKGRGTGHFDETAEGELALARVKSGSLRGVSVGYAVAKFKKLAIGEEYELATKKVKGPKDEDSNPIYIAEKWAPIEISLTPIPADHTVGIGREAIRSLDGIEIEEPVIEDENFNPESEINRQIEEKGGKKEMEEKELQLKIDEALKTQKDTDKEGLKRVFNRAAAVGLEGIAFRLLSEGKKEDEIMDELFKQVGKDRGKPGDGGEGDEKSGEAILKGISDDALVDAISNPVLMNF